MSRLKRHSTLGVRWLSCGWRQFRRNPWLLGGMGLTCSALISLLTLVPLVGRPVIALLAPIFLASAYLAIDAMTRQKLPLPASLRVAAFKRSPHELVGVFRDEDRAIPIFLLSLCSLTVALLVDVLALLVTGNAWAKPLASLDTTALVTVLAATPLAAAIYFLLAASLVYTLPLAFLRDEPLIPALASSVKASMHYIFALLVLFAFLLAPCVIGILAARIAPWAGYGVQLLLNAVVLPLVAASLYCSYRTVFPPPEPARRGIDPTSPIRQTHRHPR